MILLNPTKIKQKVAKYYQQPIKACLILGITPNLITVMSLACGLISAYFLLDNHLFFILFLGLHFLFDSLDGQLARQANQTSKYGNILDKGSDNLVGIAFYFRLMIVPSYSWLAITTLTGHLIYICVSRASWNTTLSANNNILKFFAVLKMFQVGLMTQLVFFLVTPVLFHKYFFKYYG